MPWLIALRDYEDTEEIVWWELEVATHARSGERSSKNISEQGRMKSSLHPKFTFHTISGPKVTARGGEKTKKVGPQESQVNDEAPKKLHPRLPARDPIPSREVKMTRHQIPRTVSFNPHPL